MIKTAYTNLNWSENKKHFQIQASDERKFISFVYNFIIKEWHISDQQSLSSWNEARINSLKQKHLEKCPVIPFQQRVQEFYDAFSKRVFAVDLAEEKALELLKKITIQSLEQLMCSSSMKLSPLYFQSMGQRNKGFDLLDRGQCYQYAFYLAGHIDLSLSMVPYDTPTSCSFLLYPIFFLKTLGYRDTQSLTGRDLLLYLGNPTRDHGIEFKHLALVTDAQTVKSRWGDLSFELEHAPFQVPEQYGSEIVGFHQTFSAPKEFHKVVALTNQISAILIQTQAKEISHALAHPQAVQKLVHELRTVCQNTIPKSLLWNWQLIEDEALSKIKPSINGPKQLYDAFQSAMREILPQYFFEETVFADLIALLPHQPIPTVLTKLGILAYLLQKLRSAIEERHPESEQWDWEHIKSHLMHSIEYTDRERSTLLCDFQKWAEEMFPKTT